MLLQLSKRQHSTACMHAATSGDNNSWIAHQHQAEDVRLINKLLKYGVKCKVWSALK